MAKIDRRNEFLQTTMQIVAENGLDNFAMKKVTDRMGVSESLLYKYYPTKEDLLYSCFESVHKSISSLFTDMPFPSFTTFEEGVEYIHSLWKMYFMYLLEKGYQTIFYFDFRDSQYIRQIMKHDEEARTTYFSDFVRIFHALIEKMQISLTIDSDLVWIYVLDLSGIYAKKIIRKDLKRNEETVEQIWELLSGGLLGFIEK